MTRILTTHVGSLPRPPDARRAGVRRGSRRAGRPRAEYDRLLDEAVARPRAPAGRAGIDLVSDGEMSKIGYATYIRHRLSGFEVGEVPRATPADLDAYPRCMTGWPTTGGSARYLRPICRGPIAYEHREPLERDLARLAAALEGQPVAGAFMNAPSPGIIALFQPNEYYPSLEEYLEAIGEAMKVEYEAIVAAGLQRADRRAGPGDGAPHHVPRPPDEEFVAAAARHVEVLNHALRDVPRRSGAPAPLLGQLRRPPPPRHRRWTRSSTWCWRAKPRDDRLRGGQPAPRARVGGVARGARSPRTRSWPPA